jgi:hypothetical protein
MRVSNDGLRHQKIYYLYRKHTIEIYSLEIFLTKYVLTNYHHRSILIPITQQHTGQEKTPVTVRYDRETGRRPPAGASAKQGRGVTYNRRKEAAMKHGHVTGTKRERKPRKATIARYAALGAAIAKQLENKTPAELLQKLSQPIH